MKDVREYRVTFGQKYRREPHPYLEGAHPDGYAVVWAVDERQARAITHAHLIDAWEDVWDPSNEMDGYDLNDWAALFPRGELVVLNPEMAP